MKREERIELHHTSTKAQRFAARAMLNPYDTTLGRSGHEGIGWTMTDRLYQLERKGERPKQRIRVHVPFIYPK